MLIGVVIVTYNRLEKLKKCLAAYEAQHHLPAKILVVDNASTDGTKEFLDAWILKKDTGFQKMIFHSPENRGGSGGFCEGIRRMANEAVDWIWIADDDAYPMPDCLQNIVSFYETYAGDALEVASVSAKVIGNDGLVSVLHRRKIVRSRFQVKERPLNAQEVERPVEIDLFSFVGVAIRSTVVRQIGLPEQNYFIYYDDSEYSLRIGKSGRNLYVPDAVILHDSRETEIIRYSWKNYYMFRNKLYTYKKYFPARYYYVEVCRTIVMILQNYNCAASWKQFFRAVSDVQHDKTGVNVQYLP